MKWKRKGHFIGQADPHGLTWTHAVFLKRNNGALKTELDVSTDF